ncbi:MAG: hypothetical protein WCF18_08975 [Chthoniobacteraceae bacterium]
MRESVRSRLQILGTREEKTDNTREHERVALYQGIVRPPLDERGQRCALLRRHPKVLCKFVAELIDGSSEIDLNAAIPVADYSRVLAAHNFAPLIRRRITTAVRPVNAGGGQRGALFGGHFIPSAAILRVECGLSFEVAHRG